MDFQNILVAIIISAALFYIGQVVWRKAKAFSPKSSCGTGCGCAGKTKQKI
jgi:hypothetical protein